MKNSVTPKSKNFFQSLIIGAILTVSIATALWIMLNHLGLSDTLDFGAGAYYYADMPGFERWFNREYFHSSVPAWLIVALFFLWGALMMKLWLWVDKRTSADEKSGQ